MNNNTEITSDFIDLTIASLLLKLININKIICHTDITNLISRIQTNLSTNSIEEAITALETLNEEFNNESINNLINSLNKIKYSV